MGFELERVLYETEDFLRRHVGSPARRAANKRRARRKLEEFGRRLRRAALLTAGLLATLVVVSILVGGIGFLTLVVALPMILLFALVALFWPTGRRAEAASLEGPGAASLAELALRAEEALLDHCGALPGRALPAVDRVIAGLAELQPHLAALDPGSLLAGEARRLIGQHLPRLIDSYLDLATGERGPASESSQRLIESLGIIADELGELVRQATREKHLNFETQRRFIESRYKEDGSLGGE